MNPALQRMLEQYPRDTLDQSVSALREILQQLVLLGLWRGKFFEHAAFYGGTALRILHGLDRFSEDLDFSLLTPNSRFSLGKYGTALQQDLAGFGFEVSLEPKGKSKESTIQSAFLKANTLQHMLVIGTDSMLLEGLPQTQKLKIRLEVDVNPPGGFETVSMPILQPIPFAVRAYSLPDLFAGKMHAVLCRNWRNRVKGRDWYDFVWYVANYPQLHLSHLEERMRQSGDYDDGSSLTPLHFKEILQGAINSLDIKKAKTEVKPFLADSAATEVWSRDFFSSLINRIKIS